MPTNDAFDMAWAASKDEAVTEKVSREEMTRECKPCSEAWPLLQIWMPIGKNCKKHGIEELILMRSMEKTN